MRLFVRLALPAVLAVALVLLTLRMGNPLTETADASVKNQRQLKSVENADSTDQATGLDKVADPIIASQTPIIATGESDQHTAPPPHMPTRADAVAALAGLDLTLPEARTLAAARLAEQEDSHHDAVHARAAALGVPVRKDGPGHRVAILHDFRPDGRPIYRITLNRNAAISSAANLLNTTPYSLTGSGIKVGVWDAGSVRATHQELAGRINLRNSSSAQNDHSTHVAGTIAATGVQAAAKGMVPNVTIDSYDWTNDYTEMTAAGAAAVGDASTRVPISNHSYGYTSDADDMGRYETEARSVDALVAALPYYLPFWAAGNSQTELNTRGGYQSITFNSLAKNVLTVGAVNDAVANGARSPAAATMSSFSSWGPADDGRIKPDLVANGVDVYSSFKTSDTSYGTISGTSMATPSAAGSAALVTQLYIREFSGLPRASTLKALLIHTADDVGRAGPDYQFGWGLINVSAAADVVLAHKASLASPKIIEGSITNSAKTQTHTFQWDGGSPIRATLAWTDPAGTAQSATDSRTPNLVNNLDLSIIAPDGTTTHLPYVMPFVGTWTNTSMTIPATTGKNNVDNVEQVYLATPTTAGSYTVKVTLDGSLSGTTQFYSLVLTGGTEAAANPPPVVTLTAPTGQLTVASGVSVSLTATASDTLAGGGTGVVAKVEFLANGSVIGTRTASPYQMTWTPAAAGTYTVSARATDSQGETALSASAIVWVLTGSGAPTITSFTPSSGGPGDTVVITGQNFTNPATITFNGVTAATPIISSSTSMSVVVPAGATTGPIRVTTTYGTALSATDYTIVPSTVVISQIYGGGGLAGALFNADYAMLHNRSADTVDLTDWSLQYANAASASWTTLSLTGSIPPGSNRLIKLASGSAGGALPTPDQVGSINLSSGSGKLALRSSTTAFSGANPTGQAGLRDLVGYGSANASEGSVAPALSITTALHRRGSGSQDDGNNAADFYISAPDPRNAAGQVAAPIITSAIVAETLVGSPYSYTITATGAPTTFQATGLPAGLALDSANGVIAGTPAAAGLNIVTLSATNAVGTGTALLTLTVTNPKRPGIPVLVEDFASVLTGNNITTTGSSTSWSGNDRFTSVTRVQQAGGAVRLGTSSQGGIMRTQTLDLSANGGDFTITFKVKGWETVEGTIYVDVTGQTRRTVAYSAVMSSPFEEISLAFTGGVAGAAVTFTTSARRAFIDDVTISVAAPPPALTLTGSLTASSLTYGDTPSPTEISVAGTDLAADVTVSAPDGFELGLNDSEGMTYASSQTFPADGDLAASTLWLRLADGKPIGTYSGSVTASSPGAAPVSLTVPNVTVLPRPLIVKALDRQKPFGTTLELGTGAFESAGLAASDTIEGVTLVANEGLATHDPIGTYPIAISNATGSAFSVANYAIDYRPGTLTVTGRSFDAWIGTLTGSDAEILADPDHDGLANLVEFFLGLDPTTTSPEQPRITLEAGELRFTYRRSKAQNLYQGAVEWSDRLGADATWTTVNVIDELVSDLGDHEIRRARLPLPTEGTRRFLRLRITPTTP